MQLEIFGVISLDLPSNTVKLKTALRLYWVDLRLAWDPAEYNGTSYILLPTDPSAGVRSWIPDIFFRQDIGSGPISDLRYNDVRVGHAGNCKWNSYGTLTLV